MFPVITGLTNKSTGIGTATSSTPNTSSTGNAHALTGERGAPWARTGGKFWAWRSGGGEGGGAPGCKPLHNRL